MYEPGCESQPKLSRMAAAAVAVHRRVLPSMCSVLREFRARFKRTSVRLFEAAVDNSRRSAATHPRPPFPIMASVWYSSRKS